MTSILGINAWHGDAAACIVVDGRLIAAAEEERFRRIKHWAGFPVEAITWCLEDAGLTVGDLDHVAINRDPNANLMKKVLHTLKNRPSFSSIRDRLQNASKARDVRQALAEHLRIDQRRIGAEFHNVEHHRAHLASAFFVSPFDRAAVLSVDGFGDFTSAMWGVGNGNTIDVYDQVSFPHSLGLFYLAMTQYLGFPHYGDEYKVMGLAPYGQANRMSEMQQIVMFLDDGRFELGLEYFSHHSKGVTMQWESGEPSIGPVFSDGLVELLGPARSHGDPIEQRHKDVAASMQQMYEDSFFHIATHLREKTGSDVLCLAGGCGYNSVANGKIFDRSAFTEFYGQAAAGDAGGAIGAAFWVWNQELGQPREFVMSHAYWGPAYDDDALERVIADAERQGFTKERIEDEAELCRRTAAEVAAGHVVGWFQGRMEWGPRALGNRSIVCDPRRADMKDILNDKIKRRESFRPFAPSVMREHVGEWFTTDYDVPFMLQVYEIREEKRSQVPAVTHVNGTGRLQSVTAEQNPRYHRLIAAFRELTGVPMVLNTSFNENEPVVNRPEEAFDCFARTNMDVLVMGEWFLKRR